MIKKMGLVDLNTEELKKLLQLLYRNQIEFPLTAQRIACIGFQYKHQELMNAFRDLDQKSVQAVLVCVLAERLEAERRAKKMQTQN